MQLIPNFAKPPGRCTQAGDSAVGEGERLENVQQDNVTEN
jgi:hypothetical protein